jgi:hypothetical protein
LDGSKAGIMVTAILLAVPLADEQALGFACRERLAPVSRRDPRTFGLRGVIQRNYRVAVGCK